MKYRYRVLALLFLLSMITFLDRVCLSVAGPRMQAELKISPQMWGWIVGIFALSYGISQIPVGGLGDRIGARRVLFAIVLWWSAFTFLTGSVSHLWILLAVRFMFGAGEGGAYPNTSCAISKWFPATERARAHGMIWMASRLGGALTPLLIIPLQARYDWRLGFHLLGILGMSWAVFWFFWFRDRPPEKRGVTDPELAEIGETETIKTYAPFPWGLALRSSNFWALLFMYHMIGYAGYFYLSWLNTYLQKGRGFAEADLVFLSSLPFFLGAAANGAGGFTGDYLVNRVGVKWGRRLVGTLSMSLAGILTVSAAFVDSGVAALVLLSLGAAASDFVLPTAWATCLDIGRKYAGCVTASMNTAGQISSFFSGVLFGYAVSRWQSYDVPLIPMGATLVIGGLLWLKIDASRQLVPERESTLAKLVETV